MRAGTSRGPFFLRDWLPEGDEARDQALIGAIGASDPLQLDGLGGGSTLNSKVAIVSRSTRPDCDLDYLFAQVGVGHRSVDTRPNCGNMLSGVAPFAIEQGLITAQDGSTTVRIHNVNTGSQIEVTVQTPGGKVTFLDYGLVKRFAPSELQPFEDMIRAMVIDRDMAEFRRIVERVGLLAPNPAFTDEAIGEYFGHFYEFVRDDAELTMTEEYASETVRRFFDTSGEHGEIMKAANVPKSMVIIQRINLGLYAILGQLEATANWRRMAEELWPWTDGTPSTPMGEAEAAWRERRQAAAEPA